MDSGFRKWYEELLDEKTLCDIEINIATRKMERHINNQGHIIIWKHIEAVCDYKLRTLMREYFFRAGGIIPINEG